MNRHRTHFPVLNEKVKRLLILTATLTLLLAIAALGVAAQPNDSGPRDSISPRSKLTAPAAPAHVYISDPAPGFYIENGSSPLSPASDYQTTGSYRFWAWSQLQNAENDYNFDSLDYWITQQLNAGYETFGIAIYTYTNRYASCTYGDAIFIPTFVENGPDGIARNADDPLILASNPDTRNCDGDGQDDPWYMIDYDDPYYLEQYQIFVEALADYIFNHPQGYRFKWIATGAGKDGETKAVDNSDAADADLTSEQWIATVNQITDIYRRAFSDANGRPLVHVLVQNAPFHLNSYERRDVGAYAAEHGAGVSINAITADFDNTESCGNGSPEVHCAGMWDSTRLYSDTAPIAFESYGYMMGTENEFYWSMSRALDVHADYIRLSGFYPDNKTPINMVTVEWANKYMGTGLQFGEPTPPSIWSRAWEHRQPCYVNYTSPFSCNYWPPVGNSEFYLRQLHAVSGGTTIPGTDDNRIDTMGWSGVSGDPWHYNTNATDPVLESVGLFNPSTDGGNVQLEVDPAWSTRRSDQASANYAFFYDADDRYISPEVALFETNKVIVTVTYLDHGSDRWRLVYDGVNGTATAQVYAIQNWDVGTGLAVDGGLPTSGVQNPRPSYVQKNNSNTWKTATFLIEDGYFGNRLAGGADFYIDSRSNTGASDGDEYIHHVNVERMDKMVVQNLRLTDTTNGSQLNWDPAPGDIDHYEVWRSTESHFDPGAGATKLGANILAGGALTYTDSSGGTNNSAVNYTYMVLAVDANGEYAHYQPRVGDFDYTLYPP